jgi:hypothetical protein
LLSPHLAPFIRSQVKEYLEEHSKDRNLIEVETTEAIAARFQKWGKLFLVPATILLATLGLILALLGISDYSDFHKIVHQSITELRPKLDHAVSEADIATGKAQDAEAKSEQAIRSIDAATAKMNAQLSSAQQLSNRLAGLESHTASQIADASKHIEDRVSDLDRKVEAANKQIAGQQEKLTSTNELVTAMFSKGQTQVFSTTAGNTPDFVVLPNPSGTQGATVLMRLKSAPILQTLQVQFYISVQPRFSYYQMANVIVFFLGRPSR